MASKSRRRRKHRGTQAGTIESRGRTGRPTKPKSRSEARQDAAQRRAQRFDTPPSWRRAMRRAAVAAGIFLVVLVALLRQKPLASINLALLMFLVYIPMGYYTDRFIYNRRLRQKAQRRDETRAAKQAKGDTEQG